MAKDPASRRSARASVLSTHLSRRPAGHRMAATPRVAFVIRSTSTPPTHAERTRPPSAASPAAPQADGSVTLATEGK